MVNTWTETATKSYRKTYRCVNYFYPNTVCRPIGAQANDMCFKLQQQTANYVNSSAANI